MNLWPPFLGAGIHIKNVAEDFTSGDVQMKLHSWNKNLLGTHYGGSIFSMTDAFHVLALRKNLGPDFIVFDKAAEIQYRKPGKGTLSVHFSLARDRIDEIRREADREQKAEPKFVVDVMDEDGDIVAEVTKTVSVRRRGLPPGAVP